MPSSNGEYQYVEIENITVTLSEGNGGQITALFENNPSNYEQFYRDAGYHVSVVRYIRDLSANCTIRSIPAPNLPTLDPLASQEEIARAYRFYEWQSARIQMDLMVTKSTTIDWKRRGAASLLNRQDLPYVELDLVGYFSRGETIELGPNTLLGVRILDVDYGLLKGVDEVNIFGSIIKEIKVVDLLANMEQVGKIMLIPYSQPDPGWVICNGQNLDRSLYAMLFARIGVVFGAGNGTTTFTVPNLSNSLPVGVGTRALGNAINQFTIPTGTGSVGVMPRSVALNYQIFTGVYV